MNQPDLLISLKGDTREGYFWVIEEEEPVLFSDPDYNYPFNNPILFNYIGKLPDPIFIKPGKLFTYAILDKDKKVICFGKFEAKYPRSPQLILANQDGVIEK